MSMIVFLFETIEGRVVLGLTWLWLLGMVLDVVLHRSSARARGQIWLMISCAAVVVPAVAFLAPSWRLGILTAEHNPAAPAVALTESLPPAQFDALSSLPIDNPPMENVAAKPTGDVVIAPMESTEATPVVVAAPAIASESFAVRSQSVWLSPRTILFGIWMIGVGVFCLRMALDWSSVKRILKDGMMIDAPEVAAAVAERLGLSIQPMYLETEAECAPACVGIWRPVILLPRQWKALSDDSLRGVLAHEFAHLVRGDLLIQCWSLIVRALLWPHPVSWWAQRRMIVERERAADDLAREICEQPSRYAAALLEAAQTAVRRKPALAISNSGATPLEARVRRVLDDAIPRGPISTRFAIGAGVFLSAIAIGGATLSPFGAAVVAQEKVAANAATAAQAPAGEKQEEAALQFDEVEITGTVTNPDGLPAEGAMVFHRTFDASTPRRSWTDHRHTTDKTGRFGFRVHRKDLSNIILLAVGKDEQFQVTSSSPFESKPQSEYWREVTLKLEPAKQVQARVFDVDGNFVVGAKAWLGMESRLPSPEPVESDHRGIVTFFAPANAQPQSLVAFKEGVGLDYADFNFRRQRGPSPAAFELTEMRLARVIDVPVKVIDQKRKPVAGATVIPGFRRPGRDAVSFGSPDWPEMLVRKTDSNGEAKVSVPFDVDEAVAVRARHDSLIQLQATSRRYENGGSKPTGDLWTHGNPETVVVAMRDPSQSFLEVRGRVLGGAGAPIAGAAIDMTGLGLDETVPNHSTRAHSDGNGDFSLSLVRNTLYLAFVETADHRMVQRSIYISDEAPHEPLIFRPEDSKTIRFHVVDANSLEPVANSAVHVLLSDKREFNDQFLKITPGVAPNRIAASGMMPMFASMVASGYSDLDGKLSLLLPVGEYEVVAMADGRGQSEHFLNVTTKSESPEIDLFTNTRVAAAAGRIAPKTVRFKATIVDPEGKPLSGATVQFDSRLGYPVRGTERTTDAKGEIEFDRDSRLTLVTANSADRKLAAAHEIRLTDQEAKLVLAPTAKIVGRLMDAKTKSPIVGRAIELHRVDFGKRPSSKAAATFVTDSEGRFELLSVCAPQDYHLWLKLAEPRSGLLNLPVYISLEAPGEILDLKEIVITLD